MHFLYCIVVLAGNKIDFVTKNLYYVECYRCKVEYFVSISQKKKYLLILCDWLRSMDNKKKIMI